MCNMGYGGSGAVKLLLAATDLVLGLRMHGNVPLLFMYFMGWSLCRRSFVTEADSTSKL